MVIFSQKSRRYFRGALETLSVIAPILCLIDCIVLPIAIAFLPFLNLEHVLHGVSDQLILCLVLAFCLPVLIPGYMKHKKWQILAMFSAAIVVMFFVNLAGERIDSTMHMALSAVTSFLLLKSNFDNRKLLSCSCSHHHG